MKEQRPKVLASHGQATAPKVRGMTIFLILALVAVVFALGNAFFGYFE
jgi:hypothetical protein